MQTDPKSLCCCYPTLWTPSNIAPNHNVALEGRKFLDLQMSPDKFRWANYYNALPTPYEVWRPPTTSNSRPHIDLKSETDSVCMTVTECEASGEHLSVCSQSVSNTRLHFFWGCYSYRSSARAWSRFSFGSRTWWNSRKYKVKWHLCFACFLKVWKRNIMQC